MKFNYLKNTTIAIVLTMSITSCSTNDDDISKEETFTKSSFVKTYANIAAKNYDDSYTTALTMKKSIEAFLAAPSAALLEDAKKTWLAARDYYGQTEAYREANGPIDNEDLLGTEGQINAWPLDEGYIDYVVTSQGTTIQKGLIADETFTLTEANIIAKNELGGDANISTGWHAIEFLLWGQDLNYQPENSDVVDFSVSGNRPYTDYTTEQFAQRRGTYLQIVTDLLINDLKDLKETWQTGGSYRTTFEQLEEKEALTNILNGIGFIANGEIAIERLDPAIDEGQENEHSCFSDNTNKDMWANVHGINNIIVGTYTAKNGDVITGTSLIDIVKAANKEVATNLETKAQTTLSKLNALLALDKNFDQIINEESITNIGPAGELSSALKSQGISIADAAKQLEVSITIN